MKYIHLVMADYIKPLLNSKKWSKENLKEKGDETKDNFQEEIVHSSGMGDFDYTNCPVNPNTMDEEYDQMSKKTEHLLIKFDDEIATYFEEQKSLEEKLTNFEKDLEKRLEVLELCTDLCQEGTRQIEKYSENIQKFDQSINHHEEILDSWQCLIDEFRRIPEDGSYCH